MKRFIILLVFVLIVFKLSFSTPQVRDILYWNGTTYHAYPFIDVEKRFDDAQLERLKTRVHLITTGNWRGYYYEFEICHDSLFLVSIKNDQNENLMAYVIGSDDRIMMDNYSDTLYLGYGKTFFDEDFPTLIYESEMTVVFENGVVVWTKDNKNKIQHTELPHNIIKFHECIYSSIRWDVLDKNILAEKPEVYVNYSTDSLGRVCDVTLRKSSGYPEFDNEAMRVIAALPKFSVHFVCGKYLEKKYWQRIVFDTSKRPNTNNINGFSKEKNTFYFDANTGSFVCIQNDSISIYYQSPSLEKPSCFYGTYQCSNDTLRLSDNLLKDGMKPNEYLFMLDSTHRTLTIIPHSSTINETTYFDHSNQKAMLLGRRFKNTSCFEELRGVL